MHEARTLPIPFLLGLCAALAPSLVACSATPRAESVAAPARIAPLDFASMHELSVPAPADSICQERAGGVVCRSDDGDSLVFESWKVPETAVADGDEVRFSFLGRFRPAPRLRLLVAELAHDATIHFLWDGRSGRFAMLALGYDSAWISESGASLVVLPGLPDDRRAGYDLVAFTRLDGTPLALRCHLAREAITLDSSLSVRLRDGAFADLSPDHLLQDPRVVCPVDTGLLRRTLPDFLRRP